MKIKRAYANLAGLILLAAAASFVGIPAITGFFGGGDNGYAIFPFCLTCIMLVLLLIELRRQVSGAYQDQYVEFRFPVEGLATLALIFVYYMLFKFFNYYVGTAVFAFGGSMFYQKEKPVVKRVIPAAVFTAAYCIGAWAVFVKALGFRI